MKMIRLLCMLALVAGMVTPAGLVAQDDVPPPPPAEPAPAPPAPAPSPDSPDAPKPPAPTYPMREKQWTTNEFKNAFVEATKQNVTTDLGPPDDAANREWIYRGMKISDQEAPDVSYSIVRLIFSREEPFVVKHVEFTE